MIDVIKALQMYADGHTMTEIARHFHVTRAAISLALDLPVDGRKVSHACIDCGNLTGRSAQCKRCNECNRKHTAARWLKTQKDTCSCGNPKQKMSRHCKRCQHEPFE